MVQHIHYAQRTGALVTGRNGRRLRWLVVVWCCFARVSIAKGPLQSAAQPEILDRVVASIRGVAVTQGDVVREDRLERFLATGRVPAAPPGRADRQAALARLIDQRLLAGQLAGYRINENAATMAAGKRMAELRKKCGSGAAFDAAIHQLGIGEDELRAYLMRQEEISAMIDSRLRVAATIEPQDIEDYYRTTFLPAYGRAHRGSPPPLARVRDPIRQILVEKKINLLLDEWLQALKRDASVEILPDE